MTCPIDKIGLNAWFHGETTRHMPRKRRQRRQARKHTARRRPRGGRQVATRSGARKAVIEPERPYSPKNWVARSGGEMRAINVLEAESAVTKKSAKTWFVAK